LWCVFLLRYRYSPRVRVLLVALLCKSDLRSSAIPANFTLKAHKEVRFCHIWTYEMAKGYVLYAK
jgi:hypothetical protein